MQLAALLKSKRKPLQSFAACIATLALIHLIIFHNHWLAKSWFPYDFPQGYYATVAYWVSSLQSGEWPQWIPYESMGYPVLMNPQMGLFYPPFWIFVILRLPFTLHAAVVVQLLHVLFGSIGFLLLAHRLFKSQLAALCGAVAFLFFGGFYTNAEHADIIRGFAWVPWLLWSSLLTEPRLTLRNLLLPACVVCFITGCYTGQVIAGLFLLGLFLCFQASHSFFVTRDKKTIRILLAQLGLLALGVLLASPFLFTGEALAGELTRSRGIGALPVHWLTGKTLFDLIFPSILIHPRLDYSMYGMQLPAVFLLFLSLIGWNNLRRLLPLLATAAVACLLAFQTFAPFSNALRRLVPPLGLSRFPAGDYREFLYLAILLLATGGLASVLRTPTQNSWRRAALAMLMSVLFALICISCLRHDVIASDFPLFLDIARRGLVVMLTAAVLLFFGSHWRKPEAVAFAMLPLTLLLMLPQIALEHAWWSDPNAVAVEYGPGFPLEVNGHFRTRAIFQRRETQRPPRLIADNHHMLSWWGYLDGVYLANDTGGVIPQTRRTAEANPELLRFMLEGSRLLQVPCDQNPAACSSPNPDLPISGLASAPAAPTAYSRNTLSYNVNTSTRSLIIENEMALPGWHVAVDGTKTAVRKVDGCLRAWIVPPGKHHVALRYQTPLLRLGLFTAAAALAAWMVILWRFLAPRSATKNSTPDCVILVSSDRTGG